MKALPALSLVFCLLLCACGSEEPAEQTQIDVTANEEEVAGLWLETGEQIFAALPEDIRDEENLEGIMEWHRSAFHDVVVEHINESNAILKESKLEELVDLQRYETAQEAREAAAAAKTAVQQIRTTSQDVSNTLKESKRDLLQRYENIPNLRPVLDRLPINYLAMHAEGNLALQAETYGHVARAIELYAEVLGGEPEMKEAVREELLQFKAKHALWEKWTAMEPKEAVTQAESHENTDR